mgnify:CR=1 FL=1
MRERLGRRVLGQVQLIGQKIDLTYLPKNYSGRRMWCLSENRSLRIRFIDFFRELMSRAREIQQRWKVGDFSVPYPAGLYPPCMPKLVEPLFAQ